MGQSTNFFSLYRHNFVRVAIGIPRVRVADPGFNVTQVVTLMQQAAQSKALLVVFLELGLSAYSYEGLFHQQAPSDATRDGLCRVLDASRDIPALAIVGVPVSVDNQLFNCAAVVHQGRLLGLIPKTYLPNYRGNRSVSTERAARSCPNMSRYLK